MVKNPHANAEDEGLIPGLERFPGGGNGSLLLYSCLENPMGGVLSLYPLASPFPETLGDYFALNRARVMLSIIIYTW